MVSYEVYVTPWQESALTEMRRAMLGLSDIIAKEHRDISSCNHGQPTNLQWQLSAESFWQLAAP